ncbi:MAG TPA: hypothetical protein VF260_05710 [Bacilli bacterium]
MDQHSSTLIIMIALILFAIYRRVRRNIGWQHLRSGSMTIRIVLFLVVGLLFFIEGVFHPISLISDIAGIGLGVVLALYGAKVTDFAQREGLLYYRPNVWIGAVVTFIFLARFVYRFYGVFSSGILDQVQQGKQNPNDLQNLSSAADSWTAGLMLIMFAYYVVYYMILLKKQKQLQAGQRNMV